MLKRWLKRRRERIRSERLEWVGVKAKAPEPRMVDGPMDPPRA